MREVVNQHLAEDFTDHVPTLEEWFAGAQESFPGKKRHYTLDELCNSSADLFGGEPNDYREVHAFLDSIEDVAPNTPAAWGITHSTFGLGLAEQALGWTVGPRAVPTRTIAEKHILAQYGHIPSIHEWLSVLPIQPFMYNQAAALSRILEEA